MRNRPDNNRASAELRIARRDLKKQKGVNPKIHIIERSVAPLRKMSGQIVDPFGETQFGFEKTIKPPYSMTTLLDFYEDNTWNNACVNLKANLVCGDFEIVSIEEDQKEDSEYNKLSEFLEYPNEEEEDIFDIFNKFWVDIEALGNGYFEIIRNSFNQMKEIYHIPAHTVRKAKKGNGYFHMRTGLGTKYVYFNRYKRVDMPGQNEIVHHKNYFPASKYYGMPDYMPALGAMAMDRNAVLFNNNFFNNSGMLGMILFIKGAELSNEARNELMNMVEGNFTGVDNAHRMAVIDGLNAETDYKIEKVMESVRDMSFNQLRKFNRDEIIASHHVPPKMLHVSEPGRLGESNDSYNQMKFFKLLEIDPSQRRFENIINKLIKNELGITKWKIKFKELDIRDPKDENEEIWGDMEHMILEPDEARKLRGREPLEKEPITTNQEKRLVKIQKYIERLESELEEI